MVGFLPSSALDSVLSWLILCACCPQLQNGGLQSPGQGQGPGPVWTAAMGRWKAADVALGLEQLLCEW